MSREYIDAANRDSLVVYEELLEAVEECRRHDEFRNLAAIFFHDLMRVLTGFALRRNELDRGTALDELDPLTRFPYVGYQDIRGRLRPENKDLSILREGRPTPGSRRTSWQRWVRLVPGPSPLLAAWSPRAYS